MRATTGVARLAVRTGAPVIPVAQFGAQSLYGRDRIEGQAAGAQPERAAH